MSPLCRNALRAIILCACLQGCIFSPKKGNEKVVPPIYEKPRFPEAVIRNLALAYARKDSSAYVACYDSSYTGTSLDQLDPTPQLITVTWADEAHHIGALSHSSVSSISINTVPNLDSKKFHDGGDPPGWTTIQSPFFGDISITDPTVGNGGTTYLIPTDYPSTYVYKFKPYLGAGTDTTWKIVNWTEIRQ